MNKIAGIILLTIGISGLLYAQTDTAVKKDTVIIVKPTAKTAILPAKAPTNWSKIKDLFL